jgi:hypothetical protein
MAIQLNSSIIEHKREALLDPAYTGTLERGMVMVYSGNTSASGDQMVIPSTGVAADDVVAGILWLSEITQETIPTFEDLDVPGSAPYTMTLRQTPTAIAEMHAERFDGGAAITLVAGVPAANQIQVVGRTLTAHSGLAGVAVRIFYRYAISAAELARRGGRRSINNGPEGQYGQVTLCYGNCRIMLSNFLTQDTFLAQPIPATPAAPVDIYTAANGKVSSVAGGKLFGRCFQYPVLLRSPGIEQAFIGVEANMAGVP